MTASDSSASRVSTTTTGFGLRALTMRLGAYVRVTKPRVIELLLVITAPAMALAERGLPPLILVLSVLVGGALTAAGANALNCWIERDRDGVMERTRRRPLPAGDLPERNAFVLAVALEIAGVAWLWVTVNLLAALLALAATLFYVFVYTLWLKPRTPQNIVIGGAAGAVPVLIGWAAVTGQLDPPAWVMFAIVFFWTPPHFWALSVRYRDDYAAAGIPMLPVVRGVEATARQILMYSVVVTLMTLALVPIATMGALYLTAALGLGGTLMWQARQLQRDLTARRALRFFAFSNGYLALLFATIAVDAVVGS